MRQMENFLLGLGPGVVSHILLIATAAGKNRRAQERHPQMPKSKGRPPKNGPEKNSFPSFLCTPTRLTLLFF